MTWSPEFGTAPTAAQQRVLAVFCGRLRHLPIATHPALFFNPWVEGYRNYAFGGRAGPKLATGSLFHELGHAAQMGCAAFKTRASVNGFVFKTPRRFVFDRYCEEPETAQATLREIDTVAHQLHLMRLAGLKVADTVFMGSWSRILRHMPDCIFVPGHDEAQRESFRYQRINERYSQLTPAEVCDKLEAWLDATQRRLKRNKENFPRTPPCPRGEQRYRIDATAWRC